MQGEQEDFTGVSDRNLALRKVRLEFELLSIKEEQTNRQRERNPRGVALKPPAVDSAGTRIHVDDKVKLCTKSKKGTAFANVDEAVVVGWNAQRTDIVVRKIENNGDTTTRRAYYLTVKDVSATQTQKTPVLQDKTNSTPTGSGPSATSGSDKSGSKQQSRKPVNSREKVHKALTNLSKDFQGNDERIGVLGLPSEGHLTHRKHPDEFLENVMNVAGTDYNYGMDLKPLLEQNKDPRKALALLEPVAPEDVVTTDKDGNETVRPPSYGDRFKYETKYKQHHVREQALESNMGKVYELMLGQCTPLVRQELKGREDYDVKHAATDVLWLIQELRKIYIGIDEKSNPMLTYSETILNFTNIRQYATETIDDFMKRLVTYYLAAEDVGGKYVLLPLSMYDAVAENSDDDSDGDADRILLDKIKEEFLAMMLMQRSDRTRFGAKLRKLKEDSEEGNDNYPKTLRGAYDLLLKTQTRWMEDAKRGGRYRNGGFSFYQGDENKENQCLVCGVDGRSFPGVQCHFCKEIGHYKGQCPKLHGEKK
eukprot:CAMPEP_0178960488 /NCGR_PEP_ID=MMETSP0789-20121207/12994_1 /TAXON_ID=3005 /ORGANISM="Rhizosolenia setigera, Strain CCMP 1694" /LENGTH=536 /DNA_ID=CAMNT_0020643847 /DNA_START=148 /DNA_END=1759 /DNA_ORIENTATION=-